VNELREDLDRALRAVTFGEAPVERAKRDGRRIRTRRRVTLLAGALAVAAVVASYPALTRSSAAPPAPATGTQTPAPHRSASRDPVITDGPGDKTTQAPGGLASASGIVAAGTMGGVLWQVTVDGPGAANPVPAHPCFTVAIAAADDLGADCTDLPAVPAAELNSGAPAVFSGVSDAVTEATIGEAAADVTYFVVSFTDGQQLKLIPVTAHGHRYVAWIAPLSMTVASVIAHLGGPYSDSGQAAIAVPFDRSGQAPVFGAWQQPNQAVPPPASGVIARGVAGNHVPWSAVAYVGPWGSCTVVNGKGFDCMPFGSVSTVAILGPVLSSVPGLQIVLGAAPARVAKVTLTLSDGKAVTAKPVTVGNARLFAAPTSTDAGPTGWTTYDASGHQVGTGTVPSASGNAPKSAKP
jgi:hypothetical protein